MGVCEVTNNYAASGSVQEVTAVRMITQSTRYSASEADSVL